MLGVILYRLFGSWTARLPGKRHLEREALRDLKQVAGMVVTSDSLCVSVGSGSRYLNFDPPLRVCILCEPDRMVFESLTNRDGETLVLYAVEVLAPERLP